MSFALFCVKMTRQFGGAEKMNRISSHALINFALDLSGAVTKENPFEKLIAAICATINCDAVALLLHEQGTLIPVAQRGISPDVMGRRFLIHQHPRLKVICGEHKAVRFTADCTLPDPYDGMICNHDTFTVHSCMGIPLYKDSQLLGVLTLDSVAPNQFDLLDNTTLDPVAALASGFLATCLTIKQLQSKSNQAQHILQAISEHTSDEHNSAEMIGTSNVIKSLKKSIRLAASSELTVLIEGESGVGKELVARALHQQSNRKSKPLVYVNCAAIARHLIESELFGHVKGAFTNADKDRQGKFLLADGGTLFLDEIGELPLEVQGTLLRAIQHQEIQVVGKDTVRKVDVRIIAATNRHLEEEVNAGRFRNDLYHRLGAFPIHVPPLRDRRNDIPLLAGFFTERARRKLGLQQLTISGQAMDSIVNYAWPGNIRELEHVISRAALYAREEMPTGVTTISPTHLTGLQLSYSSLQTDKEVTSPTVEPQPPVDLKVQTNAFQRTLISDTLKHTNGNWSKAAQRLSMDRANLSRLAKRLGVKVEKKVTQ